MELIELMHQFFASPIKQGGSRDSSGSEGKKT
jgi:hypothetical protein